MGVGGGWRLIRAYHMMWDADARGWGPGRPVVVAVARGRDTKEIRVVICTYYPAHVGGTRGAAGAAGGGVGGG